MIDLFSNAKGGQESTLLILIIADLNNVHDSVKVIDIFSNVGTCKERS